MSSASIGEIPDNPGNPAATQSSFVLHRERFRPQHQPVQTGLRCVREPSGEPLFTDPDLDLLAAGPDYLGGQHVGVADEAGNEGRPGRLIEFVPADPPAQSGRG